MIRILRKINNAFFRGFDRRALKKDFRFTREDKRRVQSHQTAAAAAEEVIRIATGYDAKARLKMIVSAHPIRTDGKSSRWEFFFDLPSRRAKLQCGWFLALDETGEVSGPACVEVAARLYPSESTAAWQKVDDGKLSYKHLKNLWKKELQRTHDLPKEFLDTDHAIHQMIKEGLDVSSMEFTFSSAEYNKGGFCWVAQTDERSFQVPLT